MAPNLPSKEPQDFPQVQPQEKSTFLMTTAREYPPVRMAITKTLKTEKVATSPVRPRNTDTPWTNTSPALANLFIMWSSWPMPPTQEDNTTATDGRSAHSLCLFTPHLWTVRPLHQAIKNLCVDCTVPSASSPPPKKNQSLIGRKVEEKKENPKSM